MSGGWYRAGVRCWQLWDICVFDGWFDGSGIAVSGRGHRLEGMSGGGREEAGLLTQAGAGIPGLGGRRRPVGGGRPRRRCEAANGMHSCASTVDRRDLCSAP